MAQIDGGGVRFWSVMQVKEILFQKIFKCIVATFVKCSQLVSNFGNPYLLFDLMIKLAINTEEIDLYLYERNGLYWEELR